MQGEGKENNSLQLLRMVNNIILVLSQVSRGILDVCLRSKLNIQVGKPCRFV